MRGSAAKSGSLKWLDGGRMIEEESIDMKFCLSIDPMQACIELPYLCAQTDDMQIMQSPSDFSHLLGASKISRVWSQKYHVSRISPPLTDWEGEGGKKYPITSLRSKITHKQRRCTPPTFVYIFRRHGDSFCENVKNR